MIDMKFGVKLCPGCHKNIAETMQRCRDCEIKSLRALKDAE